MPRGRPKSDARRNIIVKFRMNEEEYQTLIKAAKKTHKFKSEVLRQALNIYCLAYGIEVDHLEEKHEEV